MCHVAEQVLVLFLAFPSPHLFVSQSPQDDCRQRGANWPMEMTAAMRCHGESTMQLASWIGSLGSKPRTRRRTSEESQKKVRCRYGNGIAGDWQNQGSGNEKNRIIQTSRRNASKPWSSARITAGSIENGVRSGSEPRPDGTKL